jgi:hypothetical protein
MTIRVAAGWQAKAPAPQERKPLRSRVGQTLSSVNLANPAITLRLLSVASRCSAAALLLAVSGCNYERIPKQPTIEEAPRLASTVHMGDPTAAAQLLGGFHDIEGGSWRWTQKQFAVTLRPPVQASRKGAVLELHLTVPQPSIEKLKILTLTASVGGATLAPETYNKAGEYTYRREVDAKSITSDAVRIDFQLDKAIEPGAADLRELGIVVASVGLVAK